MGGNKMGSIEKAEMLTKRIAENIRCIVAMRKLNMGDIEKTAGVSQGYISRKCRGGNEKITIHMIVSFADVLGVEMNDLMEKDYASDFRRKRIAELEEELRVLRELEGEKIAV